MQYHHKLDLRIISQIEKQGKCTFNELKEKTRTNSRTLTVHLNALEDAGILVRKIKKVKPSSSFDSLPEVELVDGRFIGIKRYCYLSEAAKFERKIGILKGVISKRERRKSKEQSPAEKARLFYQLLLLIAPSGALRYRKKSKVEPGDILLYDPKERRNYPYELYVLPGFGESDFLDENIRLVSQFGGVFGHLVPSKKDVGDFFKRLKSFDDPPIISQIEDERGPYKEARYILADKKLEELMFEIWKLYDHVYNTLEAKWKYLKKPTRREYAWYRMFYGNRRTTFYFTNVLSERNAQIHNNRIFAALGPKEIHQRKHFLKKLGEEKFSENYEFARKQKDKVELQYKKIIEQYSLTNRSIIKEIYSSLIRPMINEIYSPLDW
jgi:DNA-binding Lrp family transcriptional regulator